ncbi:two-component system, OmpR family, sensor kinase [Marinitoga hydrogenitolerans DSM 16785]|uniref:histidine kinase n=1 Tax=Marinitoga hydrogenitolerans (strain DSM 16785 / JCM 12826 / AT1271) TaxID=1122195 RepID=A0A1M4SFU5_MARH1|nr:HAMP domain-containing sensor histidine kinase [Marinitoga hydrogenitolerans]SHE31065.1 two-component system, OmpR family, sensor kinase [Marinitoga hydrogenitolerans DSM 16785]
MDRALDYINEMIIKLNKMKIEKANIMAKSHGFKKNHEIISVMTFNEIDLFVNSILERKDFFIETTIYFFQGTSKFCKINYLSNDEILIIEDKTEKELLKQVKADFITSLSHELRTPLSVAKGNIFLLEDIISDSSTLKIIKKSKNALRRIERILDQLTLLSMAEFGSYMIKTEIFDPENLIEEVRSDLENKIKNKNIKINFKSNIKHITGDPFIIYTIIRNLVSNSIKYSHNDSEINITIDKDKIVVKDNGIGIRDNEKARIFERFYRGIDAKKYAKGSGLGLAIVKYLCELAGYKIEFDSKWMIGTTFTIYLENKN